MGPHHYKVVAVQPPPYEQQLDTIIQTSPILEGAIAGISIRDAKSGAILYDHNGSLRLKPASNLKLITSATALSVLGEDYTFHTEVLTDGVVKEGLVLGNVYLKGKGDPTLLESDLDSLAKNLKRNGITSIKGDLIADDSWFDDVRYSIDMPWSDEETYYGGQVSALTLSPDRDYDTGTVIVEVRPGKVGKPPAVSVKPETDYVVLKNNAKTVDTKGERKIKISREHGKNVILIDGTIPADSTKVREWIATWEPTGYALNVFHKSLQKAGISILGKQKIGTTPQDSKQLGMNNSMPLSEIMVTFMKQSNNGIGEAIIKEIGQQVKNEGTWEQGLNVVHNELKRFGINEESLVIRDGSGISHVNLIKANDFTKLLHSIQSEPWFNSFYNSLPIAGSSERIIGGTLFNRMHELPDRVEVRAKTGTITTVSTLSGYITTQSGKKFIFSILLNNLVDEGKGKELEDQIVNVLANL